MPRGDSAARSGSKPERPTPRVETLVRYGYAKYATILALRPPRPGRRPGSGLASPVARRVFAPKNRPGTPMGEARTPSTREPRLSGSPGVERA